MIVTQIPAQPTSVFHINIYAVYVNPNAV